MSEKAPVVAKSDVEAQPIWERGADGVRTPPLVPAGHPTLSGSRERRSAMILAALSQYVSGYL